MLPFLGAWWALVLAGRGFAVTWLVGVTAGVVVRALVLGHHGWNQLSFLAVALVFIGAVAGVLYRLLAARGRDTSVTLPGDRD